MDDFLEIIVSFIVGVLITIFTITYTLKEGDRWRINQCIESVGTEININKTKYILFKKAFDEAKIQWKNEKTLDKKLFFGMLRFR
jgi:hypothetical protein